VWREARISRISTIAINIFFAISINCCMSVDDAAHVSSARLDLHEYIITVHIPPKTWTLIVCCFGEKRMVRGGGVRRRRWAQGDIRAEEIIWLAGQHACKQANYHSGPRRNGKSCEVALCSW
jgi:hypothetical protein